MKFAAYLAALIVLCTGVISMAQTPPPSAIPVPQEQIDTMQHWRDATVALGVLVKIGDESKFIVTGSAVIVSTDENRGCLLTAKHMLVDPENGRVTRFLWMRIASDVGESEEPIPLLLFDRQGRNTWMASPDADLAVIPMPFSKGWQFLKPKYQAIVPSDFGETGDDIFQGAQVLVLGYPQVLRQPDSTNPYSTSPIARHGIIAWVDPSGPITKPFLVDANLYPGNSGGPVFRVQTGFNKYGGITLVSGNPLIFIGIVSEGAVQNAPVVAGGQQVTKPNSESGIPEDEFARVIAIGGIGKIEPASKARALIEKYLATVK